MYIQTGKIVFNQQVKGSYFTFIDQLTTELSFFSL